MINYSIILNTNKSKNVKTISITKKFVSSFLPFDCGPRKTIKAGMMLTQVHCQNPWELLFAIEKSTAGILRPPCDPNLSRSTGSPLQVTAVIPKYECWRFITRFIQQWMNTFSSVAADIICCNTIFVGIIALCIDTVTFLPPVMSR